MHTSWQIQTVERPADAARLRLPNPSRELLQYFSAVCIVLVKANEDADDNIYVRVGAMQAWNYYTVPVGSKTSHLRQRELRIVEYITVTVT